MSEEKNVDSEFSKEDLMQRITLLIAVIALILSAITYDRVFNFDPDGMRKVIISKKYDKKLSYEKAMEGDKPVIVFFYTDWCHFCQRFAPVFDKVVKNAQIKKAYSVVYVNCDRLEDLPVVEEFRVDSFPRVYVVTKSSKVELNGETFFQPDSKEILIRNLLELVDEGAKEQ